MIYNVPRGTLYFIRKINNKYNKNKKKPNLLKKFKLRNNTKENILPYKH